MQETNIFSFLIPIGTSLVSVPVILWIVKLFAKSHVDSLYQKNFEKWKQKIDLEYDKSLKINQKEIEVLPDIWNKAVIVRDIILRVCLNRTELTVDLAKFDEISYRSFVNTFNFPEFTKLFLLNASNRNAAYLSVIADDGLNVAARSYEDFQDSIDHNKIFITKKMTAQLQDLKAYYHEIIGIVSSLRGHPQIGKDAYRQDVENGLSPKMAAIADMIKERIRFVE